MAQLPGFQQNGTNNNLGGNNFTGGFGQQTQFSQPQQVQNFGGNYQQPPYQNQQMQQTAYPQNNGYPQQQPVQNQNNGQNQRSIEGTHVLRAYLNPNFQQGAKTWLAVVTVATDEPLYLNNLNIRNGQNGLFITYPSHARIKNGQTVIGQNGQPVYDEYYAPYSSQRYNYNGRQIATNLMMPLIQQAIANGQAFANLSDPYRNSRFTRSQSQGSTVAYGSFVTQKGQLMVTINGIFVYPVYNEDGSSGFRLQYPQRTRMQNGQPVIGQDGYPQRIQFVLPTKESNMKIMEAVGKRVNEEIDKIRGNQQPQQTPQNTQQQQAYPQQQTANTGFQQPVQNPVQQPTPTQAPVAQQNVQAAQQPVQTQQVQEPVPQPQYTDVPADADYLDIANDDLPF